MKTIFKAFILTGLLLGAGALNAQNFEWVKRIGGLSPDGGTIFNTVDASGNVYIAGTFLGTVDFDPGPGTVNLTALDGGSHDFFLLKMDALGNLLWVKRIGGPSNEHAKSICVTASGNIYITGSFWGTVDFNPAIGATNNLTSLGDYDIFVLKMDSSGNFLWAKRMGGTENEFGVSICTDISENVYTTGYFYGTVDFDPGPGTANRTSSNQDVYVQKMDSSGNFLWVKTFGAAGHDTASSSSIDAFGNIYMTGSFHQTVDFDPNEGVSNLTSAGILDVFVQKMDASGNFLWAKALGGTSVDESSSLTLDASGNVYTTGYFNETADFDPGAGTYNLTSAGYRDVFVQKMDASGHLLWAKAFGGVWNEESFSLIVDGSGNVYTTGSFFSTINSTIDLDPGLGNANFTSAGDVDIFIQKMDAFGNFLWGTTLGESNADIGRSICVDNSGSVYATGKFEGTIDFQPGTGITNITSAGNSDIFILKLTRAQVDGYVFVDENENGLKDIGEIPVPIQNISYNNGNNATTTNNEGSFSVGSALGTQVFNYPQLPSYYTNTTPLSQTVDVQLDIIDTLYFGIQPISDVNDLVIDIHPSNSPRPGFTRNYQINYQNVGTTTLEDVTLKFLKTEEDNVVSATGTYTVSSDTLIWNLGTLEPFSMGSFTITDSLSASATLGDFTLTQAWIIPSADDAAPENNVVILNEEIIGSYDPNDKSVTPEVSEPTENEPLKYMVRFQNTGNYQADFVVVRDTLSTLLDLTTFQMIAASHNYELAIENRIAVWTFPQINLPDSTSDEPGSHGFIKFKVQRVDGLGLGTQIPNRVGIYFDYNAPVITNTCIYSIETCPSSAIDVQTACNSFTWMDGNTYTSSNNTATHVLNNAAGCDSIVTLNLTINTVSNIGTTTNGASITANNDNATYQWLDCDNNNEPIEGATNQTFTATGDGNYAVEVTENGCTNTSACVAINVIGIDELSNGLQAAVYPNPSQGNVEITLGSTMQDVELMLTDIQGRVIFTRNYPSLFKTNIELPNAKGVYVLKLKAQDSTSTIRLVKE